LGAKIVQAERNAKQKTKFFACISEAPPIFAAGKVVQAERNGKQKTKFFACISEAPPIFASLKWE